MQMKPASTTIKIQDRSGNTKVKGRKRSERASVLLTISAAGDMLKPLIIFKGKRGGRVEEELANYPEGAYYSVQKNAWMDEHGWHQHYIGRVWEDYIYAHHPGGMCLVVDNLKCHVNENSVRAFGALGIEVVPLPKYTTAVLQPLDAGMMGPFKKKLASMKEAEMVEGEGTLRERLLNENKKTSGQKRIDVAKRIIAAWEGMKREHIVRCWEKTGIISGINSS